MTKTSIEWTDFSASLLKYRDQSGKIVWHCEKVSPGCAHCYSETIAERFKKGGPFLPMMTPKVTPFFDMQEGHAILRSKKLAGKRVFVNDMTDMFGPWVSDEIIHRHFAVFAQRPDVTFQVLTKRADRMADYVNHRYRPGAVCDVAQIAGQPIVKTEYKEHSEGTYARLTGPDWPLKNVWLGASCEDQQRADERIPHLLKTPAAVRFLSVEPLLGPIEFSNATRRADCVEQLGKPALSGIGWVIVGGESGHGARPMKIAWARSIVSQCKEAGIACFVKQLGSNSEGDEIPPDVVDPVTGTRTITVRQIVTINDRKGGEPAEWPSDLRVREFPATEATP